MKNMVRFVGLNLNLMIFYMTFLNPSIIATSAFSLDECNGCTSDHLQEIQIMKKLGSNDHIINILGSNIIQIPLFIVLEYAQFGDLKQYLTEKRVNVSCVLNFVILT